jgi:HEAT repeat protein
MTELPELSLDRLVLPDPRADVPFADAEDAYAEDILTANDVPLTSAGLRLAVESGIELLQAAAARAAAAQGDRSLIGALRPLATGSGDTSRAAAAHALARLGEPDGHDALVACLDLPLDAYVAPIQAAGSLAQLGDERGFGVVERATRSSNQITRAVAVKQLPFFGARGKPLLEAARGDDDPEIAWQAGHLLGEQE